MVFHLGKTFCLDVIRRACGGKSSVTKHFKNLLLFLKILPSYYSTDHPQLQEIFEKENYFFRFAKKSSKSRCFFRENHGFFEKSY